jgi:hypothetical protein
MDKEKYTWLKTLSIGFIIAWFGIVIAVLGAIFIKK